MAIQIADQFSYSGVKPLDARFQYATVADMKAAPESSLYDGCFAYVKATKKYYSYDSSNSVDTTTGRWREYQSGSGEDAKAYHTDDTAETTIADADYFPFYDTSATAKRKTLWSNIKSNLKTYFDTLYNKYTLPTATSSVLGGVKIGENMTIEDGVINPSYLVVANKFNKADLYSTTEKVVGCWTDGRPIYQKTNTVTSSSDLTVGNHIINHGISNVRQIIAASAFGSRHDNYYLPFPTGSTTSSELLWSTMMNGVTSSTFSYTIGTQNTGSYVFDSLSYTLQYTKTTDAANSFKYAAENDYSTSEKIVGTWINGATLYQRTFTGTLPSDFCSTDYTATGTYSISFNSSYVVRSLDGSISISSYEVGINDAWGIYPNLSFVRAVHDKTSSGILQIQANRTVFNSATYYLMVKYTK